MVPNSSHLNQHRARYLVGNGLRHFQASFGVLPILFRPTIYRSALPATGTQNRQGRSLGNSNYLSLNLSSLYVLSSANDPRRLAPPRSVDAGLPARRLGDTAGSTTLPDLVRTLVGAGLLGVGPPGTVRVGVGTVRGGAGTEAGAGELIAITTGAIQPSMFWLRLTPTRRKEAARGARPLGEGGRLADHQLALERTARRSGSRA